MVPVSPQCPQEIISLTLPPPVLQGTAVSSEHIFQHPPGNVAVLGGSLPFRRSPEQIDRLSPADPLLQGTDLAALSTPEVSFERLIALVDYLAVSKFLPNVLQWVLHTVERGKPLFNGACSTLMGLEQALVMEREVDSLLRKKAIEVVPPHYRESGFYSRYFIIPKKDGGLRPIIDLRLLNRHVTQVQNAQRSTKLCLRSGSEDWFVTIDLKDAYFHKSILL